MRVLSVLILLVCVQQGAMFVSAQCKSGGPGFPLPVEHVPDYGMCAKGFYCPNSDPNNESTYPRYCPPDKECQEKRKDGEFCEPQSPLEPEVCHSGKYCPTATEMLPCPEGKWCPYGTHEPHDCHALMHCPEGTNIPYDYSSILFMLLLDILAVLFYIIIRKRRRAMWVAANEMDEELKKHEPKEGAEESHEPDTQNAQTATTMPNVPEGADPANPSTAPEAEYHAGAPHAAPSHSVPIEPHPQHVVRRPLSRIKVADNSFLSRFMRQTVNEAKEDEDVIFIDPIDPSPNRVGKPNAAVTVSDPNSRRRADVLYEHDREIIATGVEKNRGAMQPLLLRFGNLSVSVNVSGKEKVLLKGITGAIRPGRVTAIMGPSGAGKTVFMTRLLNKGEKTWKTDGELRVNGFADSLSPYQHMLGYVPQDDIMHPELSVLENVWFSAENRLPKTWEREERLRYVIAVIRACGLESVMHTPVGTGEEPNGVSRKRTSIAIELAGAPSAIFLDEPTTGLDSATALDLCALLKSVAVEADMTVAMVIHQPRVEIWDSLDEVLLIAPGGRTVYQGPQKKAQEYFEEHLKLDFSVGNPADIILDGIAEHQEECESAWENYERPEDTTPQRKHHNRKQYEEGEQVPEPPKPMHANFFRQIILFHYRSVLKQAGHAHAIVTSIVMGIIAAAIMGSAAVRTELIGVLKEPYSLMNPRHNMYLVPMLMMFYGIAIASSASAPALRALCDDRTIYWKEASTGRVNKIAYFIGMTTGEFYRLILTVIHFTVVAYFMWNPAVSFWWFFFFIGIMFCGNDAQAAALGLIMSPKYAPLLATVVGVFIALLNGFPDIPGLYYIAFPFYCTEGFLNRFSVIQDNVLNKFAYDRVFRYHFDRLALDIVIAILIVLIYRVIGFLLLVFTFRNKQR